LSEVFKVRVGLTTADRDQVDRLTNEMDSAMTVGGQRRDDTLRRHRLEEFASRHFLPDSPPLQFNRDRLRQPLLAKNTVAERRASTRGGSSPKFLEGGGWAPGQDHKLQSPNGV